jgi:FKBP-type peptidyl-prolyl cis-trans isomerase FklB
MRIELKTILAAGLAVALSQVVAPAEDKPATTNATLGISGLTSQEEEVSYAIGMNFGSSLKRNAGEVNLDILIGAFKDAMAGKEMKMTEQQAMQILRNYQRVMMAKRQEEQHKEAEKNRKEGETFLAENKKKEGVKTLEVKMPEGTTVEMQYKVLKEGTGPTPKSNDMVTVLYRGTLLSGKEFDASTNAAAPAKMAANRVIRGWTEALEQMKVGSKWQLFIPSPLAYGEYGRPPTIEPGSLLIFDIELLGTEAPAPPPQSAAPPQPLTSDIIRVPSAEELKAGAKPEVIKAEDVEKLKAAAEKQQKKP